jgi:membrane protease subunit (stomatin/prohibitin family)
LKAVSVKEVPLSKGSVNQGPVSQIPVEKSYVICVNCKEKVKPSKFCQNCGLRLTVECPNCKKQVDLDKFCTSCGARLLTT